MKKYYYVYKIINKINQHEYIGFHSTNNLNDGYMGSGKLLPFAYAKYGIENFEKIILKMFDNKKDAESYERELVNIDYINRNDTYNISIGGNICILYGSNNGFYGKTHSKETIEKIKEKNKRKYELYGSPLKNRNFFEDDDVIINGIRYSSKNDAMLKLHLTYAKFRDLLVMPGNYFVDPIRQQNIVKEYENNLANKKLHKLKLLEYTKDPVRNKKISNALKGRIHTWQDKINKNPEKIAKTAAKHKGMKRTKKTCKNISNAKKMYYEKNVVFNKNCIFIHNIKTGERKYISKNDIIPNGWEIGIGSTCAKGKKWYMNPNDFSQTKNFSENEQIPDGWIPGNGNLRLAKLKIKENNGSINR